MRKSNRLYLSCVTKEQIKREARVSELMSKPGDFRYKSIRAALQKAQRETGV